MTTIDSGNSPGTRIEAGSDVLRATKQVSTAPVAKKLAAFKKLHATYVAADKKVKAALGNKAKQERLVGTKDAIQDDDLDALATKLAGDGLPRTNPFKPLGAPAPSELRKVDATVEAEALIKLAGKVEKYPGLSDASRKAGAKMALSARAVLAAAAPLEKLGAKVTKAIADRDALARPWEKAFAVLKRGARTADDDGAQGLYDALFVRGAAKAPAKKKRAKKAAKGPQNGGADA